MSTLVLGILLFGIVLLLRIAFKEGKKFMKPAKGGKISAFVVLLFMVAGLIFVIFTLPWELKSPIANETEDKFAGPFFAILVVASAIWYVIFGIITDKEIASWEKALYSAAILAYSGLVAYEFYIGHTPIISSPIIPR